MSAGVKLRLNGARGESDCLYYKQHAPSRDSNNSEINSRVAV